MGLASRALKRWNAYQRHSADATFFYRDCLSRSDNIQPPHVPITGYMCQDEATAVALHPFMFSFFSMRTLKLSGMIYFAVHNLESSEAQNEKRGSSVTDQMNLSNETRVNLTNVVD